MQQQRRSTRREDEPELPGSEGPPPTQGQGQAQAQQVDDLLDEIDSVLESDAESFVQGFVQKGGQ